MAELPDLPEPVALDWPGEGLTSELIAIAAWSAHMYDTGADPLFSADQMRDYARQAIEQAAQEGRG